jgi:mercuric ion transport protein
LAAAFGVASCCALPILLASFGLGSAWLIAIAWLAAPHRIALLTVTAVCLVGGIGLLLRRRRAAAVCPPGLGRRRFVVATLAVGTLSLAAVLAGLGLIYGETPR